MPANKSNGNGFSGINPKLARIQAGGKLRLVDLFAGCGGMSLGFHRAGYQILGGVELDPKAAKTHAINFFKGHSSSEIERHSTPHDITKLSPEQFMLEVLGVKDRENLVDIIIGGPPCQAFARIGRAKLREIMDHPQAFLHDNRASLYLHFLKYVEFFHPLAVVMENVPDIMNFGGQNVAEEIASSLQELGYRSKYTILNSAHYGVPQMRQRFFLMALLDELEIEPSFPLPTRYHSLPQGYDNAYQVAVGAITLFNSKTTRYIPPHTPSPDLPLAVTAKDALVDLPLLTEHLNGTVKRGIRDFNKLLPYRNDIELSTYAQMLRQWPGFESKAGIYDHVTRFLPRDYKLFGRMSPGDQYPQAYKLAMKMFEEVLEEQRMISGKPIAEDSELYKQLKSLYLPPYDPGKFPNKWRKMEPDQPSRTLTAHIGKDTYSHIHYDSSQARVISVREAARLQSFPDGFTFTGPMNTAFRQIGNAVPPLQAYALAVKVHELVLQGVQQETTLSSEKIISSVSNLQADYSPHPFLFLCSNCLIP